MLTVRRLAYLTLSLSLLAAAGGARADHHAVKISMKDGVGRYLTDAKGMTLYTFKQDMMGMSHCEGACIQNWPAYFAEKVAPGDGLQAADFGTISRPEGGKQTTYKGMPLYYFAGDKEAGDVGGQGLRGAWYAATP